MQTFFYPIFNRLANANFLLAHRNSFIFLKI